MVCVVAAERRVIVGGTKRTRNRGMQEVRTRTACSQVPHEIAALAPLAHLWTLFLSAQLLRYSTAFFGLESRVLVTTTCLN